MTLVKDCFVEVNLSGMRALEVYFLQIATRLLLLWVKMQQQQQQQQHRCFLPRNQSRTTDLEAAVQHQEKVGCSFQDKSPTVYIPVTLRCKMITTTHICREGGGH